LPRKAGTARFASPNPTGTGAVAEPLPFATGQVLGPGSKQWSRAASGAGAGRATLQRTSPTWQAPRQ